MELFFDRLKEACPDVRRDEPMKDHTTFRVGGPADYFAMPENELEIRKAVALCREEGVPYFILGNGSNLLVSDKGYRGMILCLKKAFGGVSVEEPQEVKRNLERLLPDTDKTRRIFAGAGVPLARIAQAALEAGLTGFEFASGIPGTLGGALVMNAGAYGGEMSQVVEAVRVLTEEGVKTVSSSEMEFGYRKSCILPKGYLAAGATIRLTQGNKEEIKAKMEELSARRREKQPLEYPSAGSTFKRPEGCFAGKLIMDAGLRGFQVGGACVSEKHCGFVVNKDGATAADILELCRQVRERVKEKFGVILEMEVRLLGDFS